MASPIRRRALLWALLPVLVLLNLLRWTDLSEWLHQGEGRVILEFDRDFIYDDWIELGEEDFARLEAGKVPVRVTDMRSRAPVGRAPIWVLTDDEGPLLKSSSGFVALPERDPDLYADESGIFWLSMEGRHITGLVAAHPDGE